MLDEMTGTLTSGYMAPDTERGSRSMYGQGNGTPTETGTYGDSGGPSRFFFRADYDESDVPVE